MELVRWPSRARGSPDHPGWSQTLSRAATPPSRLMTHRTCVFVRGITRANQSPICSRGPTTQCHRVLARAWSARWPGLHRLLLRSVSDLRDGDVLGQRNRLGSARLGSAGPSRGAVRWSWCGRAGSESVRPGRGLLRGAQLSSALRSQLIDILKSMTGW
jgi:hypothetical protein